MVYFIPGGGGVHSGFAYTAIITYNAVSDIPREPARTVVSSRALDFLCEVVPKIFRAGTSTANMLFVSRDASAREHNRPNKCLTNSSSTIFRIYVLYWRWSTFLHDTREALATVDEIDRDKPLPHSYVDSQA